MYQQYIRPEYIRKAVHYLKGKYPFYNDLEFDDKKVDTIMEKLDECEEDIGNTEFGELQDNICIDEAEDDELEEIIFIKEDAVRKNQTSVSSSTFLMPENLEGKVKPKKKKKKRASHLKNH